MDFCYIFWVRLLKLSGQIKYIKNPFLCWSFGCVKMCRFSRSKTAHPLHFNIFYLTYLYWGVDDDFGVVIDDKNET